MAVSDVFVCYVDWFVVGLSTVKSYLINLWLNGFSYTKLKFSVSGGYAKLYKQTIYLLIRCTVHNYDKIISLCK
jgi:hypothetical protein